MKIGEVDLLIGPASFAGMSTSKENPGSGVPSGGEVEPECGGHIYLIQAWILRKKEVL